MADTTTPTPAVPGPDAERIAALHAEVAKRGPAEAFRILGEESNEVVLGVVLQATPPTAVRILAALPEGRREAVLRAAPAERREQWLRNQTYPEGSVGRLMDPALAVFPPELFLTTATDVASMGLFLGLATWLLP